MLKAVFLFSNEADDKLTNHFISEVIPLYVEICSSVNHGKIFGAVLPGENYKYYAEANFQSVDDMNRSMSGITGKKIIRLLMGYTSGVAVFYTELT